MLHSEVYKYFHFSLLKNVDLRGIPHSTEVFQAKGLKQYKVSIRKKLVYLIEIYDYDGIEFLKFYPKIHENNPDKYQLTTIGLTYAEIRKLLNTCCKIVLHQFDSEKNKEPIYCFFGQWYSRDNQNDRLTAKRFNLYEKQVTTYFSHTSFKHFKIDPINLYCLGSVHNRKFEEQVGILLEKLSYKHDFVAQFMTESAKRLYLDLP